MIHIEITPGVGIGPIRLGESRSDVRGHLEEMGLQLSSTEDTIDYFLDNAIQVEYADDTVSFIGISNHDEIRCTYQTVDVVDSSADRIFELIAAGERQPSSGANTNDHCFAEQIVTVWEPDKQYDLRGGYSRSVYAQVGLGDQRCREAVAAES